MDVVSLLAGLLLGGAVVALWSRARRREILRREKDLEASVEAARAARTAIFDLATHELRSPLSAIMGYQELLEDHAFGPLPDRAHDAVARLGGSARHLLHLIDGVIELGRLRSGDVRPRLIDVDLGVVVSTAAEVFRTHAADRGMDTRVDLPTRLPVIRTDQDRLVRALDLLVTSAVKHPAGGELALDVAFRDGTLDVTLHPVSLILDPDVQDPVLRPGIRLAVAGALAELLGGGLELEPPEGPVRTLHFRVRDAQGL